MTQAINYWSISSQRLYDEAQLLGLTIDIVNKNKNIFYISSDQKKILFKSTDFGGNSALGFKICNDKGLTYDLLGKHNLPIAKSHYIDNQNFKNFTDTDIQNLKYPLIIKPLDEAHGNGVMMNILDFSELIEKLRKSLDTYSDMIIQEQANGEEVRVLIVKGDVIFAVNRVPATVYGDGNSSISELIEIENKNPLRGKGYDMPLAFISIDNELLSYIEKQDLSLESIPEEKEKIQLRGNSNTGTGGTMINVTGQIHPRNKEICIQASKILGLEISGVDLLSSDISQDISETGGIILEINATPGLGGDFEITGINTAKEMLLRVFDL